MYAEYKNVPVHRVQECMWSTGLYKLVHRVQCKLSLSYDTESPQPDNDLYDIESLQPYISICNPVSVYIVLIKLIIPGGLENVQSTTMIYKQTVNGWFNTDTSII